MRDRRNNRYRQLTSSRIGPVSKLDDKARPGFTDGRGESSNAEKNSFIGMACSLPRLNKLDMRSKLQPSQTCHYPRAFIIAAPCVFPIHPWTAILSAPCMAWKGGGGGAQGTNKSERDAENITGPSRQWVIFLEEDNGKQEKLLPWGRWFRSGSEKPSATRQWCLPSHWLVFRVL